MPHVELIGVSKVFGPSPHQAIKLLKSGKTKEEVQRQTGATVGVYDADVRIDRGEIFVVMGLSGSGKSTLLRCINRIHEPTVGAVKIDGVDITRFDKKKLQDLRRTAFGMVFQRFALFPHRTVTGNVEYGLEVRGVPRHERVKRVEEALELVGLAGWGDRRPNELSGGMQQRVGLARALAVDPDILLMDEAFSALDPLIKRGMQDELLALQSRMRKTIIFITHDLDEALKLGDRIAIMKDGVIVQIGTPEEIVSHPADAYVEAFTSGVDRSKVLTAGSVMKPADPVIRPKDGPQTALRLMRSYGISSIYAVDRGGKLIGLLSSEAARKAADQGASSAAAFVDPDIGTVSSDESLKQVMLTGETAGWPVAVVGPDGALLGVIVKGAIVSALAPDLPDADDLPRSEAPVASEATV